MQIKSVKAIANVNNQFVFQSGDGFLESVNIVLAEQERATTCEFSFYDPGLKFLNLFLLQFQEVGGIYVPKELFSEEKKTAGSEENGAPTENATDPNGYLKLLESKYGKSDLSGLTPLGRKCYKALSNPNVRAFLDAIAIAEIGVNAASNAGGYGYLYGDVYGSETFDPKTLNDHPRRRRTAGGLTSSATGRYQTMDFVWDDDTPYSRNGLGLKDFKPISQEILAVSRLIFRGVLEEVERGEFAAAVNGNGKRGNGANWEWASLEGNPYGQGTPQGNLKTFLANAERSKQQSNISSSTTSSSTEGLPEATSVLSGLKDSGNSSTSIDVSKSIKLFVGLGFDVPKTYEFILTGVNGSNSKPETTKISGKQVRAIAATGDKAFKVYRNTTTRILANQIASAIGATVLIDDEAITSADTVIDIVRRNETSYQSLLKAAKNNGLFVRDEGTVLKIEKLESKQTIRGINHLALLPGSRWGDSAASNRNIAIENSISTTESSAENASTETALPSVDLSGLKPSTNTPGLLELSKQADQEKGIGKGFVSNLVVTPLLIDDLYEWQPGEIVETFSYGSGISRKFRLDSIRHSWQSNIATCQMSIYLPVSIKQSSTSAKSGDATASPETAGSPDFDEWSEKWKKPAARGDVIEGTGRRVTSPFGMRTHPVFGDRRLHGGTDIDTPSGVPLYPVVKPGEKATIFYQSGVGGAGNIVRYEYEDITFLYFHLQSGRMGSFESGQVIAYSGNTGVGTGAHLHVEIYPTKKGTAGRYAVPLGYLYWILTGRSPS